MEIVLPKKKILDSKGNYKHTDKVLAYIMTNRKEIDSSDFVKNKIGIFNESNFSKRFSISGSFIVKSLDELGKCKAFFLKKNGRYFRKGKTVNSEFHLRGPRYIIALDPHYSVIQKLNYLNQDIEDSINFLSNIDNVNVQQFLEIAPVLDYLKNALLTIFNAYTHKEKLLNFELSNTHYQSNRLLFLKALEEAIYCYYLTLVNKLTEKNLDALLKSLDTNNLIAISNTIKSEFRNFSFSSKSVVRPEASHPLILLGYSFKMAKKCKSFELVFGLPSGSTELACLIHKIISDYYKNKNNVLCLIPISFHSINNPFTPNSPNFDKVLEILPTGLENAKKGLLVDDNSATGITLEQTSKLISKKYKHIKILNSVVEADLIRIKLNIASENDFTYTNHQIFKHSVSILPISKIIYKKHDLKEVIEYRLLYTFYKNIESKNLISQIKNEVIADAIENKIDKIYASLNSSNAILSFKHTFLSNFYAVPIIFEKRLYSSVEQAYLRQKFSEEQLNKLTSKQKRELNEILKIKGLIIQLTNFSKAFNDSNYAAGILKRFSNKLKEWGLEDKKWDDKRLDLMIELLVQKYSTQAFMTKLLETNNKILVEGNTWNDTFWGVCNGKGKNFLGRILMNIRQKIIEGKITVRSNS